MTKPARTVLIVVGAVLAVCCLGGVGGGFWLYRTYDGAAGPAREAAVAYLDDLRDGDYPGAYGRLCREARTGTTQEEFTRIQSAQVKIRSYDVRGVSVSNDNGRVGATVTFRMVQETGATFSQDIPLRKESDEWRVCP